MADRHLWEIIPVRDLFLLSVVAAVLVMAYSIRAVTVPILVGLGLAYIFNPLVCLLERKWRWPRWLTTAAIMAVGFAIFAVGIGAVLPRMLRQAGSMIRDLSQFLSNNWPLLAPYWETLTERMVELQDASRQQQADAIKPVLDQLRQIDFATVGRFLLSSLNVGVGMVGSAFSMMTLFTMAALIVGFCFFFFSWRFEAIVSWFRPLVPRQHFAQTAEVLGKMDRSVAAFIRGRLVQAGVMAGILSLGWWLTGVPYWLLLGVGCGLLNLVPFAAGLGWLIAIALTLMHAWTTGGPVVDVAAEGQAVETAARQFPWMALIGPSIVYWIAQGLDSWVIEPIVQGSATGLDALSVLLAVIIGGTLAGLLGMLLAIPVTACLKILMQDVVLPRLRAYAQTH